MRDLAFLRQPLPTPAKGLDSVDPALAVLASLADKEQYDELEAKIEALFDEGIHDVRAISYYLWIGWARRGIEALAEIFETLAAIVRDNLEGLGPVEKREAIVAKRIAWLAQKLGDAIEYHEAKRTAEWRAWSTSVSPADLDRVLAAAQALDAAIDGSCPAARPALMALAPRLHGLAEALARPVDEAPAEPAHSDGSQVEPDGPAATAASPVVLRAGRAEVGVSPAYFELVRKLDAFKKLVEKRDLTRASIVADDVMNIIEHFDPRAYFPEMFADFSELLSTNVDGISAHWQERDSVSWKLMVQFYRVDLRRFVGG